MSESEIVDKIFGAVKGYVETRVAAEVEKRMATAIAAFTECKELDEETLEERLTVRLAADIADRFDKLPKAKDGEPGKDADPVDVPKIAGIVEHATAIRARALIEELFAAVPKAKDGEPGPAGKDAPPVDVDKLIDDVSVAMWPAVQSRLEEQVAALPKAEKGDQGPPGKDAPPVAEDKLNERVAAMVYHVVGKAIKTIPLPKDGEPGECGEPGRDAVAIEILDAIDERKRYARTTYARHDGGIWFAAKTTTPIEQGKPEDHGWICVVAGLAGFDVTVDLEARELTVEIRRSGGEIEKQIVYMPFILDRGVYNATKNYERFDVVSHDGSGWIAQCDSKDIPGTSKSWRLFVMRGRNGKDASRASVPSADVVRLR